MTARLWWLTAMVLATAANTVFLVILDAPIISGTAVGVGLLCIWVGGALTE
jgi:hypothetical protein